MAWHSPVAPLAWPPSPVTRRRFLALSAGAAGMVLTGCSSDEPGDVADDGSVTVKHAFGETRIPAPPTRVVSAGYTDHDDLLALGVVPVAVTDWFGGEPFGVWPWAQPKLGGAQPAVLSLADGVQVDAIAALEPDLIVATNAGLDADTYARLSEIAPTVAQSGPDAFFEPWRDQAHTIGQAVFKYREMGALVASVDDAFTKAGEQHPAFKDKKALLIRGVFEGDSAVVTPAGWRTDFLGKLGLTVPEAPQLVPRAEMADVFDRADVLIWTTESDEEQAALLADPLVAALAATAANRNVFTGKELAGAIAYATVLSYPVVAERLPAMLAGVLS